MRLPLALLLLLLSSHSLAAQQLPEWYRVYTFDDSIIEMNTLLVTHISKDITRARFRWTFDQPTTLPGDQKLRYKTQLDVIEFNCSAQLYRPYHTTFFDIAGNMLRVDDTPGKWSQISKGSMTDKLLTPACELLVNKKEVDASAPDAAELENAAKYAHAVAQHLEQAKDFKPVINRFFITDYLNGYRQEKNTNWFLNLNREVADKISRRELERYYVALMNTGYLSSLYLISQLHSDSDESALNEKVLPADVLKLIRKHPYSTTYKTKNNYDFLAENIDNVQRLRSYTDLLEKITVLMRKHVRRVAAERSQQYKAMLDDWDLYQAKVRVCTQGCFGLPPGTKLFAVNVPIFNLQLARVGKDLRVVSAISSF